jgi:hypothetical protein
MLTYSSQKMIIAQLDRKYNLSSVVGEIWYLR